MRDPPHTTHVQHSQNVPRLVAHGAWGHSATRRPPAAVAVKVKVAHALDGAAGLPDRAVGAAAAPRSRGLHRLGGAPTAAPPDATTRMTPPARAYRLLRLSCCLWLPCFFLPPLAPRCRFCSGASPSARAKVAKRGASRTRNAAQAKGAMLKRKPTCRVGVCLTSTARKLYVITLTTKSCCYLFTQTRLGDPPTGRGLSRGLRNQQLAK